MPLIPLNQSSTRTQKSGYAHDNWIIFLSSQDAILHLRIVSLFSNFSFQMWSTIAVPQVAWLTKIFNLLKKPSWWIAFSCERLLQRDLPQKRIENEFVSLLEFVDWPTHHFVATSVFSRNKKLNFIIIIILCRGNNNWCRHCRCYNSKLFLLRLLLNGLLRW